MDSQTGPRAKPLLGSKCSPYFCCLGKSRDLRLEVQTPKRTIKEGPKKRSVCSDHLIPGVGCRRAHREELPGKSRWAWKFILLHKSLRKKGETSDFQASRALLSGTRLLGLGDLHNQQLSFVVPSWCLKDRKGVWQGPRTCRGSLPERKVLFPPQKQWR
jgi:hypothetical protein